MNVMVLLLFIGIVLAVLAVSFFVWNVASGTLQHADRLALLPLREDTRTTTLGTLPEKGASIESNASCKGPL